MRTPLAGALCLFIAGCSSASSWMKYSAPTPPPEASVAKVIFYRSPAFGGNKLKWEVWDGDRLAGISENGGYFEYLCAPGPHLFHLMGGLLGGGGAVEADLAGGKTYYLRVDAGSGLVAPPIGSAEDRRKRDEDFGRCDCRELRPGKATEERLAGVREKARKHVEELRATRSTQMSRIGPDYGE